MKKKKHITLAIIAIIIAALAFGYAYLTTTLSINGTTDIDANNWDVYFDNVSVTPGSVTGEQEIEAPTITSDTEVEFHVNLKKPGDFYEFTVEARNDGTIDAMINSVSKKLNGTEITTLPTYLNYTVTYIDDFEVGNNHLLESESFETYKIRVEFKDNISASDLPSTAQSLTLSFGVEYAQADENAIRIRKIVYYYTQGNIFISINREIEDNPVFFNTMEDAIADFGSPYVLRHSIYNNVAVKSYIVFIREGIKYELQGGGATYNGSNYELDSPYFERNKMMLKEAFGAANCVETSSTYECEDSETIGETFKNGYVFYGPLDYHNNDSCFILEGGGTHCGVYIG